AAPYTLAWNTIAVPTGPHTLTAVARDASGNTTVSAAITVTVNNDTTPPSVAVSWPIDGATVTGTVMVTASASDNVGVTGVQLRLDGAPLGAELAAAPYTVAWDTTAVTGAHTLTAVARDAWGSTTVSAAVT